MYSMVENTTTVDTLTGLVVFLLGGREYCADIREISAIINPNELKERVDLKSENPSLRINNLDIPILNLHKYFDLTVSENEADKRILTVEPENNIFGFYVDKVKEIFTMNRDLKEKIEFVPFEKEKYLVGVLNFEGRNLYLPDFSTLFKSIGKSSG
jgi:chemotaxis signal transduction protein